MASMGRIWMHAEEPLGKKLGYLIAGAVGAAGGGALGFVLANLLHK